MRTERQRGAYPKWPVQLPEGGGRLGGGAPGRCHPPLGKQAPGKDEREERLRLEGAFLDRFVVFSLGEGTSLGQAPGIYERHAADREVAIGTEWERRPGELPMGGPAPLGGV